MVTTEKDPQCKNVLRLLLNIGVNPEYTGLRCADCAILSKYLSLH